MDETSSGNAESESKRLRPDSIEEEEYEQKRHRVDELLDLMDPGVELPEGKTIDNDLLSILEDSDDSSDGDRVIHDLDFVIKSFEEEIIVPGQLPSPIILDPPIELGYLLEASDDDLGLPPSIANSADQSGNHEVQELPDISSSTPFATPFDAEMPNYDHFDLVPEINNNNNMIGKEGNEEFVMLGGLFYFQENWDVPEVMWRPESLPAV